MSEEFVDAFRATLGPDVCWVLFANGTAVMLPNPASKSRESLAENAKAFIKQNGPVVPGTPLGDFNVVNGEKVAGSFVTSHSEHMVTFVPQSVVNELGGDMVVGLYGRSQRHKDAQDREVVHVEGVE